MICFMKPGEATNPKTILTRLNEADKCLLTGSKDKLEYIPADFNVHNILRTGNRRLYDFDLLISYTGRTSFPAVNEARRVLRDIGDEDAFIKRTAARGIMGAKTSLDPRCTIRKVRETFEQDASSLQAGSKLARYVVATPVARRLMRAPTATPTTHSVRTTADVTSRNSTICIHCCEKLPHSWAITEDSRKLAGRGNFGGGASSPSAR